MASIDEASLQMIKQAVDELLQANLKPITELLNELTKTNKATADNLGATIKDV